MTPYYPEISSTTTKKLNKQQKNQNKVFNPSIPSPHPLYKMHKSVGYKY